MMVLIFPRCQFDPDRSGMARKDPCTTTETSYSNHERLWWARTFNHAGRDQKCFTQDDRTDCGAGLSGLCMPRRGCLPSNTTESAERCDPSRFWRHVKGASECGRYAIRRISTRLISLISLSGYTKLLELISLRRIILKTAVEFHLKIAETQC